MGAAAYLYPWDVAGDPDVAPHLAGLGLDHVVVAAAYHGIRALTPRHPRHRVVTVPHTATYFAEVAAACAAFGEVGLPVHAWVVFNHVELPAPVPQNTVNAFGDVYPWSLCAAQPAVLERALELADGVAGVPGITGVELESCGWFGFDHLGAHDKTSGVPLDADARHLLSLCFCPACEQSYVDAGVGDLRSRVRAGLDRVFAGDNRTVVDDADLAVVDVARQAVADRFRAAVVARIRSQRPDLAVLLHTNPDPRRSTAFTGADPATSASLVDGRVVNCWTDFAPLAASVPAAGPVYASLKIDADLAARAAHATGLGAAGLRLYHAGLASTPDLEAIRTVLPKEGVILDRRRR